jgi:hypothetical protein
MSSVSIVTWLPINELVIESGLPNIKKFFATDQAGVAKVLSGYLSWHNPSLVLLNFNACEAVGHESGYFTVEQKACLRQVDDAIRDILVEISRLDGESYIILTSDYERGAADPKAHGTGDLKDMTVFWSCTGPRIPRGLGINDTTSILDSPVVGARILGINKQAAWEGDVPANLARHL